MDTIRLFLRSNSFRSSKLKKNFNTKPIRIISISDELNSSNNNMSIESNDNQSTSSEKISHGSVKSFLSNQTSSISNVESPQLVHFELDTCSGLSTLSPEQIGEKMIVANVSETISNARSFASNQLLGNKKRRRSRKRRRNQERNVHHLSSPIQRANSYRRSDRIRRYSWKTKSSSIENLKINENEPFQSTYRQRHEEFRKLFKDLSTDERLIIDYSCAWQKEILIQGRMYVSQNYLCFYSNILNWKTSLALKFKDIVAITREKTAKVIPNAIEIRTNKNERYFFASFVTRDKAFGLINRIWESITKDEYISNQQMWTIIHENYGNDLDITTDEEDTNCKTPPKQEDQIDRISQNSLQTKSFPEEDDQSSISSHDENQEENEYLTTNQHETTTNIIMHRQQSKSTKESIKTPEEQTNVSYLPQCLCESHLATELIDRSYSMSVDHLFDCIFSKSDFVAAYQASRRIKDFHASEWKMNAETGKRERVCSYKVSVAAVIGSTTICSNEKQIINCERAKSYYIIDTEVRNEGIRYADSFFVASRYCLVQIGLNKSHLKVTCEVRYIKSLMAIIKTFIEKNAMAALQDSYTDLMKRMDQESTKRSRTHCNNDYKETEKIDPTETVCKVKTVRQYQSTELVSSTNNLSIDTQEEETFEDKILSDIALETQILPSKNNFLLPICLIIMLFLLVVNVFLCVKLNHIDQMTDRLVETYPVWLNRYSYQKEDIDWTSILRKQEEYYQKQLVNLQSILTTTHDALRNVTDTLNQLSRLNS